MRGLTAGEQKLLDWLAGREADMIALLRELVNIDSGSNDKAGVDAVGDVLYSFLSRHGLQVTTVADAKYGNALCAELQPEAMTDPKSILLLGHRDTVFERGEAQKRPFTLDGRIARGPGVADMKAGLVMHAFILAALKATVRPGSPVIGLFTADEEIGSPSSQNLIEQFGLRARAVFNAEPSRSANSVIVARKGGIFMRAEVTGKAAHSAAVQQEGASAIEELAHKVVRLQALTDHKRGITVNVGVIGGGEAVNMVAPTAFCRFDLRFDSNRDRDPSLATIREIIENCVVEGTGASLSIEAEFAPLEPNEASQQLLGKYQEAAAALGYTVAGNKAAGGSDSGRAAANGAPALCSVGPAGGNGHSTEEFTDVSTLVPRAQMLALTVMRI